MWLALPGPPAQSMGPVKRLGRGLRPLTWLRPLEAMSTGSAIRGLKGRAATLSHEHWKRAATLSLLFGYRFSLEVRSKFDQSSSKQSFLIEIISN